MESVIATVARVLGRLGAGQTLRLRRSGPSGTVEVHARSDGALEVPAAVLASGETDRSGDDADDAERYEWPQHVAAAASATAEAARH